MNSLDTIEAIAIELRLAAENEELAAHVKDPEYATRCREFAESHRLRAQAHAIATGMVPRLMALLAKP